MIISCVILTAIAADNSLTMLPHLSPFSHKYCTTLLGVDHQLLFLGGTWTSQQLCQLRILPPPPPPSMHLHRRDRRHNMAFSHRPPFRVGIQTMRNRHRWQPPIHFFRWKSCRRQYYLNTLNHHSQLLLLRRLLRLVVHYMITTVVAGQSEACQTVQIIMTFALRGKERPTL